jgi:tetratricopeptide (TPR) repeat protein
LVASVQKNNLKNILIILLAGILLSCKSSEKGFSLFSVSNEEKELIADAEFIEAIKQKNDANYDKAIPLFEGVIKSSKSHDAAHYELANIYQTIKNFEAALIHINQAVTLNPNNKWYLQFQIDLTKSLGLFNKTEEAYNIRRKYFPDNPTFEIEFSDFYIQSKQYDKALNIYESIEKKIGVSEEINRNKYIIHQQLRQPVKAEAELEKLISTFPSKMRYYILLADMKLDVQNKKAAFEVYERALKIKSDDPYVLAEVAHYHYLNDEVEKSFEIYEKVIANKSYGTKERIELLKRFSRSGQLDDKIYKQTKKYMTLAGEADPYSPSVNTVVGEYFFQDQKYEIAKKHYKAVLDVKKNSFLIWRQLLTCSYNLNDYESMRDNSAEALELFPTNPELYLYNGLAKIQLKQYQEAIDQLEEGIELIINNPNLTNQFQSNLADAYHALKNDEESDRYFDLTLKGDPNNYFVLNNYAYYLSERKEKLELAKTMSAKANELNPNEASFQDTYGWILFQLKDYDNALIWVNKSFENGGSTSGVINEHLGDVYFFLNQKEKALTYWNKAKKLEDNSDFLLKKIQAKKYLDK